MPLNHVQQVDLGATAAKPAGANSGLSGLWEKPQRSAALTLAAIAGILFIGILTLVLSGRAAVLILDHPSIHFFYPFTIQNVMHVIFFIALGELLFDGGRRYGKRTLSTLTFFLKTTGQSWYRAILARFGGE